MKQTINSITIFLLWILLWAVVSYFSGSSLIVPSPWETLVALIGLLREADFYESFFSSMMRVIAGVSFSCIAGLIIGMCCAFLPRLRAIVDPAVSVIRTLPVVSISILLNLWLASDIVPLAVSFFACFPLMYQNVLSGVRSVDGKLVEMSSLFKVPLRRQIFSMYLPVLRPYLSASLITASGMGWKSTVTAEVLAAASPSIGMNLYYDKLYLMTPELFAMTLCLIAASMAFEKILKKLLGRYV